MKHPNPTDFAHYVSMERANKRRRLAQLIERIAKLERENADASE